MMRLIYTVIDEAHPISKHMELTFRHVKHFPLPPPRVPASELAALTMPVLVLAARHDVFGGGNATAAYARATFRDCEVEVLDCRHVPGPVELEYINARVAQFFAERGFG